jgi:hypothetical protein
MKTNAIKENPMQLATRNIFSLASKNSIAVFYSTMAIGKSVMVPYPNIIYC